VILAVREGAAAGMRAGWASDDSTPGDDAGLAGTPPLLSAWPGNAEAAQMVAPHMTRAAVRRTRGLTQARERWRPVMAY